MSERGEFLIELHNICDMGVRSTTELLNIIKGKENKIKALLGEELKEYEAALKKVKELIDDKSVMGNAGLMAKIGSSIGMHIELLKDNSDTKIADMLIQGYTMGLLEVTKLLKKYKDFIGKEEKKIALEIKDFHNKNISELKKYL